MTETRKVRWGVLSTAKIGMTQVLPAMCDCPLVELLAISSRDVHAARAAAEKLDIPRWFGSYEELLADPDVDAVYIPLPNHLHVPWTIKALEAGKHVLCEKPVAMSEAEAKALLTASQKHPELKVMEAFMYRFHPQWTVAKELVNNGAIGVPSSIQSFFSYYNDDPGNIRNVRSYGGGAMMDIGCYPISLSRWIFGSEPKQVFGQMDRDPKFGTDRHFHGIMDFGDRVSTFTCSTQLEWHQRVVILGEGGSIELMIPFNPPIDEPTVIRIRRNKKLEIMEIPVSNHYTIQGELFSRAILDGTEVPTPLDDGVANLYVLEKMLQSAEQGQWEICS